MVWCLIRSLNSSKVCQKSVQWYPLSAFFFFSECRYVSGYQWPNTWSHIKKSQQINFIILKEQFDMWQKCTCWIRVFLFFLFFYFITVHYVYSHYLQLNNSCLLYLHYNSIPTRTLLLNTTTYYIHTTITIEYHCHYFNSIKIHHTIQY